jgi:hypothetical protein
MFPLCAPAADKEIVLYRIGDGGETAWNQLKQSLEAKGWGVTVYEGEMVVEKHVEKASRINRGPGRVFLALQMIAGERSRVMVAAPETKEGEGRFLTIDEIPGQFKEESDRLADRIAEAFRVKPKHLPLFPLLGIYMPGVMISMELKESEVRDAAGKLSAGLEKYFRERTKK